VTPEQRAAALRQRYPDVLAPSDAPECPVLQGPCRMGCVRPWCHLRQARDGDDESEPT
jgi:hypothetical protein